MPATAARRTSSQVSPRFRAKATYRGPSVGKFALKPQVGEASAGDFTATATLQVDFGDTAVEGTVEGTVGGFTVNGVSMPWSVELRTAGIGADGSIAAVGNNTAITVWSIGGNAATSTSTWSGQFHDVNDDRVPSAATGTFRASYDALGHMVGAFGTALQQ